MADTVKSKETDVVVQTDAEVTAEAPAQAVAELYQMASHSTGLELQNAVHSQQALNQISAAVVSKTVEQIMEIGDKSS